MNRPTRLAPFVIVILALTGVPGAAQVEVTLPLQGYFRPGHYMPVSVAVRPDAPAAAEIVLNADGAVPTHWARNNTSPSKITLPMLMVRNTAANLRCSLAGAAPDAGTPLRPLGDDERLIGFAAPVAAEVGPALFPDQSLIPLSLDPTQPLSGPAAAWQSLDALVLDETSAVAVTEEQVAALLSGGTSVAIRSAKRPRGGWPWARLGDYWTVQPNLAGPTGVFSDAAYLPVQGWEPGRHDGFRRNVVAAAVVFSLVVLAASLWRSRYAALIVVACSVAAAAGAALLAARASPESRAHTAISVDSQGGNQWDHWTYVRTAARVEARLYWYDTTRPIFSSMRHFEHLRAQGMRLIYAPRPELSCFQVTLVPGIALAEVQQSLRPPDQTFRRVTHRTAERPLTSPARLLCDAEYRAPGDRVVGQIPYRTPHGPPERDTGWPIVIVERSR